LVDREAARSTSAPVGRTVSGRDPGDDVRIRTFLPVLTLVAVLAGCATDPEATDDPSSTEADATDEVADDTEAAGTEELDEAALEDLLGDLDPVEEPSLEDLGVSVSDDEVRGLGVVMPLPDGWEFDPVPASQGALFASAGGADPEQLLFAVAGIESDPASGFEGLGLEDALDVVRGSVPMTPDRDEAVELDGAVAAQLLEYEEVRIGNEEEGGPVSYQAVILAEDADGVLALFNYVALSGAEDAGVTELLLADAGFDPGSEPPVVPIP
jgi:hypothetical protein